MDLDGLHSLAPEKKEALAKMLENVSKLDTWEAMMAERWVDWNFKRARQNQLPPKGDWSIWAMLAGRGTGKTAVGANWTLDRTWRVPKCRFAAVAPTFSDIQDVVFEGESGLLANIPQQAIKKYNKSDLVVELMNGSSIFGYSSQDPNRFRGPQFHYVWMDEFAAYENPRAVFNTILFALRLGAHPRMLITTTPKPIPIIMELRERDDTVLVQGSTYENRANLPKSFFDSIARFEGTDIGRQEIHGEILSLDEHAILKKSWFRAWPDEKPLPDFEYIIQSYDTAFKEKVSNDPTACTVWGVFFNEETGWYNVMLLDGWSGRYDYPKLREKVVEEFHKTRYGAQQRRADVVLIEDKGSGQSLYQDLRSLMIPAAAYNPGREDKIMRTHAISYLVKNGLVWVPECLNEESWYQDYMKEVSTFGPATYNSKDQHDDFIDTTTQALAWLRDSDMIRMDKDHKYVSDYMEEQLEVAETQSSRNFINPYAS